MYVPEYCSICNKEGSLTDRSYCVEHFVFGKSTGPEKLNFKNICRQCDDFISIAPADEVNNLHKEVAKRLNPLQKQNNKNKSLWSKIKCFLIK